MQSKENLSFIIDYLGCKVNSYEVSCVGEDLISHGYHEFNSKIDKHPDVIVINTCSVTEKSDAKDRKLIKQYRKKYKKAILVVMGCYTQKNYDLVAYELDADIVLGTSLRSKIFEYIQKFKETKEKIIVNEINNNIKQYENIKLDKYLDRTRAYVKIQDGCDNYCTYCLIPYIRGRSRSRKKEEIFEEIRSLIDNGYKEIVLTGIDMGSYGLDIYKNYNISSLLEDILKNNKDLYRLRISSIEESQIDDKFISLFKEYKNLASHLHIPLQSGSELILKKMNRKYDLNNFKEKVKKIRSVRKNISITTDIIVGFPFETDEEFEKTLEFAKTIKFSKIHCFPYSKREGTIAAKLPEQVSDIDKKIRVAKLIALSDKLEYEYALKFNNKEMEFLVENYDKTTKSYRAHSSNYLEYYIKSDENISGQIIKTKFILNSEEKAISIKNKIKSRIKSEE